MVKICPRCHHKNSDDALWCKNCKYRLIQHIGLEETIKKPGKKTSSTFKGQLPVFIREEKKGRKKIGLITVAIALILIIPTFYLLYTEINRPTEEVEFEKFIGKWISTENNHTKLIFYKNGTCVFKNTSSYFNIRKGSGWRNEPSQMLLEIVEINTNQSDVYTFEFNEEKNRLTISLVIDINDTGEKQKFRKIRNY